MADELVRLTEHGSLSRETVRRRLAENHLRPWRKDMWCIPQVDGEYVARMEDVLDLYAEPPDPKRPVVCFDESPVQLIGETRQPIPAMPGQLERYDCEYKRNGTANLFILLDVHRSWRTVKVTDSRAAVDFAACMRELCDVHFPKAERIRVVLDNLSTHSAGALYQAFPAAEARRMLRRLEFHYTPKHASWLNMVEIEIGVLRSQCLDRVSPQKPASSPKSQLGNDTATLPARVFNGCSQPTRPEPKWAAPIPTPTSHNYRAAVLGFFLQNQRRNASNHRKLHIQSHNFDRLLFHAIAEPALSIQTGCDAATGDAVEEPELRFSSVIAPGFSSAGDPIAWRVFANRV